MQALIHQAYQSQTLERHNHKGVIMGSPNLLPAPSFIVGPTWQRLESGGFYLPEKTLGDGIVNWMFEYLIQPTGPRAGEPFLVTHEQYRFLLWWYAVDPSSGRFIYRNG